MSGKCTKLLTEQRMKRYRNAKEMAGRVSRAIDRVLAGETETSACRAENVDVSWLRRFVQSDISIGRGRDADDGLVRVKLEDWIDWQDHFLHQLAGKECYAPEGFDDIFEECLAAVCTEEECAAMRMRFRERMTLRAIGDKIGKSSERVRQIESKTLRKLRYPRYRLRLMYGSDYEKQLQDIKTAQAAYDQVRLEYMNKSREEMLAAVLAAKDKHDALVHETQEFIEAAEDSPDYEKTLDNTPISDLELSVRAQNALRLHYVIAKKDGNGKEPPIETVGQLSRMTMKELRKIRNLGAGTAKEIADALYSRYGITLQ